MCWSRWDLEILLKGTRDKLVDTGSLMARHHADMMLASMNLRFRLQPSGTPSSETKRSPPRQACKMELGSELERFRWRRLRQAFAESNCRGGCFDVPGGVDSVPCQTMLWRFRPIS